ncbi:hypothetical protein LXA43DRAFT_1090797 [Ganoderma leucocontextum]|nr:hypothetical protein LXA43DRAFT_1090797 [Ganoderma leucocontextum]
MASSNGNIKATVAILGGTGDIGMHISKIFLTEYRSAFPTVRITTRDPNSPKAQELAKLGAELHTLSEPIDDVLSGVDVAIDALPPRIPGDFKDRIPGALLRQNVKVYFLSEYGIDYRIIDFPGYEHVEWTTKRKITAATRAAVQGKTKVVELMTGIFQGWVMKPDLGIDVDENVYTPLGPGTLRFATTGEDDIGRSLAHLSILALNPATVATVPDRVRIAGHNVSYEEVRDIVARVKGVPTGAVRSGNLKATKDNLSKHPTDNILEYIMVVIGEGKVDFSDNANELVNPGQRFWKWRSIEDELRSKQ